MYEQIWNSSRIRCVRVAFFLWILFDKWFMHYFIDGLCLSHFIGHVKECRSGKMVNDWFGESGWRLSLSQWVITSFLFCNRWSWEYVTSNVMWSRIENVRLAWISFFSVIFLFGFRELVLFVWFSDLFKKKYIVST